MSWFRHFLVRVTNEIFVWRVRRSPQIYFRTTRGGTSFLRNDRSVSQIRASIFCIEPLFCYFYHQYNDVLGNLKKLTARCNERAEKLDADVSLLSRPFIQAYFQGMDCCRCEPLRVFDSTKWIWERETEGHVVFESINVSTTGGSGASAFSGPFHGGGKRQAPFTILSVDSLTFVYCSSTFFLTRAM